MMSRAKGPTKAERKRFERIASAGCVACRMAGVEPMPAEIHHLLDGGKRRGHAMTIGLCSFHHRGTPVLENVGPSLAHGSKLFRAFFGDDSELLEYQNSLLLQCGEKP